MSILDRIFRRKPKNEPKTVKVRFPSMTGDENRVMTVQELQHEYRDYLIIDPNVGEQVDLRRLAELDIEEVVAIPPITGG